MVFTAEDECLTAEYYSIKKKIDKKNVETEWKARWWLSGFVGGKLTVIGSMQTSVESDTEEHVRERLEYLSNYVAEIITSAKEQNVDGILEEFDSREIVASVHAKWHSQVLNGVELEEATGIIDNLLSSFGIKNKKKVLKSVFDKVDFK